MATIRDVADIAGVSIATVSRVLNSSAPVSPELEQRVTEAVRQLGYRPNVLARNLRRSENLSIGMLIPDTKNPFFAEMAKGMEDYCFEHGFLAVLCNTDERPDKAISHLHTLYQQRVAGFAVVSPGGLVGDLQIILDDGYPIVVADRPLSNLATDSVVSDNYHGAVQVVEHLTGLGHRNIGFIIPDQDLETIEARWEGVKAALVAGLSSPPTRVYQEGGDLPESGYRGAKALLERPDPPTAIFAFNDLMALGVLHYAQEHRIRVPEDLSVVGFDDILIAQYTTPSLTTIAQPKYELGQKAAELLLRRISGDSSPVKHLVLPTQLVIRRSTAPPSHT